MALLNTLFVKVLKFVQRLVSPEDAAQLHRERLEKVSLDNDDQCQICPPNEYSSFNYRAAVENSSDALYAASLSLKVFRELKFGTLFWCDACKSRWYYLNPESERMERVFARNIPDLFEWSSQSTRLPDAHVKVLDLIGATTSMPFAGSEAFDDYPCRVVTTSGEDIQMAVVRRQRHAPIGAISPIRYASEIAEIHESPFALPQNIRIATTQANEVRKGLAMTFIESQGQIYFLRWTQNFFRKAGHDPKDATLVTLGRDFEELPYLAHGPYDVVYFIAD